MNRDNPLGTEGKLAAAYAEFIQNMWLPFHHTFNPYEFKSTVNFATDIFEKYTQHNSQEFFSFLVDGIHEDLNRIKNKPDADLVEDEGRKDEAVALESWMANTKRNQSIITDVMTGQYKSKIVCPGCLCESITFHPFRSVSLPIPEESAPGVLKYYIMFKDNEK